MSCRDVMRSLLLTSILVCGFPGCGRVDSNAGTDAPKPKEISGNGSKPAPTPVSSPLESSDSEESFQFVELKPNETGVDFQHVSGNAAEKPFPAANGSGVGVVDLDLDGLADLYFATGANFPLIKDPGSPSNRIYRNHGNWKFKDVTRQAGLETQCYSAGVAVGDLNTDGFPDIYVTCFGANQLFINAGDGTFEHIEICRGGQFSTSAAFLDFDGDGLLDIYVCNYGRWSFEDNPFCGDKARNVRIFCSPKSLEPEQDRLLRNSGDGGFADFSEHAGLNVAAGRAQGVLATDVNLDGNIDLYIGNDIHPNYLFLNTGQGRFTDSTELSGTGYDNQGKMQASMGVAGADVNRDGTWDVFTTNFEGEFNTLYLQSTVGDFQDATITSGLASASKPWVGWGTAFADFDQDGWKDLIVTNGHVDDNLSQLGRESPYEEPGLVWKNELGHFRFLGEKAGSYFHVSHPGRGLAIADLDNDGDQDVVITHQDQQPALLRNDNSGRSFGVRLIGRASNRDAIGSLLLQTSESTSQLEQIQGGGSYLSSHDLRVIFPASIQNAVSLTITWPSGKTTIAHGLQAGHTYDIVEPDQPDATQLLFHRPN